MPDRVRIVAFEQLSELWTTELAPWLREHGGLRRPGQLAATVVAPDVTRLGWLKRTWLATGGGPLLGLRFWSPARLRRELLARHFPDLRLATGEDLVLAARLALADAPEGTPLGVVGQNPAGFLAAWDAWLAARGASDLFAPPWRGLPGRLARQLEAVGLVSTREADARLAALPPRETPGLGPLLLDGFTANEAALHPLLRAALEEAESGLITVPLARDRPLEHVWVGTHERIFATEATLAVALEDGASEATEGPFAQWAQRAERAEMAEICPPAAAFRLFRARHDEVAAIVRQVARWLADEAAEPAIGVVLPDEPLLVRAVGAELVAAGLPVHDTFGYFPIPTARERVFAAWVGFQRTGQLVEADALLEASVSAGLAAAEDAPRVRRAWADARERTLSDDLAVLTAWLAERSAAPAGAAEALTWARAWIRLPETGSLALFLELCAPAFAAWGSAREFAEQRREWTSNWEQLTSPVSRELFLEWLWNSLRRPGKARHPDARDTFSPVQLVSYGMVRSAPWTHLLLAGLNERLVPPPAREGAFLLPDAAPRHLRRHLVEGPQGLGQEALEAGAGFLLDDADRRALLGGALFDAVAEAGRAVLLTATYAPEGSDRSATVVSEYFQRFYRAAHGAEAPLPTPEALALPPAPAMDHSTALPLAATGEAYARRFDSEAPFDAFSFGFERAPAEPLTLGARDWEAVLQRPAAVWLQAVARVRPRSDFSAPVALSLLRGAAVHRLLRRPSGQTWYALADEEATGAERAERQADRWRQMVEHAHAVAGRRVPLLWREQWGQVRTLARRLAETIDIARPLPSLATEYPLPDGARWVLPEGGELRLRGRVDALLVDDPDQPGEALVIDFKTGGDAVLKLNKVREGEGLQLVLYGGALADAWQCPVGLCLLKPGDPTTDPQLVVEPGEDPSGLLAGLIALGTRGVLGFAGAVRSEYAYVGDYPIAFVAPPAEIVMEKWRQTHPLLEVPKGTLA
ncbi:MAG: PD-(D/E)XK nuclease family protein [Opitutales bacterium]